MCSFTFLGSERTRVHLRTVSPNSHGPCDESPGGGFLGRSPSGGSFGPNVHATPGVRGRVMELRPARGPDRYLIRLMMLNIGRYRAMTDRPTAPPTKKIMIGSMIDVRASTVAVTSSS
jgi:hypothetical protein